MADTCPEFKRFEILTGLTFQDYHAIMPLVQAHADDFAFCLYVMKHTPTWDMAAVAYAELFHRPRLDERSVRRRVMDTLQRVIAALPFNTEMRFHCECVHFEHVTTMIDCTPVRIRGDANTYNGKYHTKVRKYQVYTDLRGIPIDVQAVPSRQHDAPAARQFQPLFDREEWELTLGDKGYVGVDKMLVPFKNNQMHEDTQHMQTNFNEFHSLVRAKIEHLFARVRKWEFFAHSRYTAEVTDMFVMAAYRIQSALMLMHHSDEKMPRFVTWRADPEGLLVKTPREARDESMRQVWVLNITNLRGKAPKKRARGAPAFTRAARAN
jgi:hypothetical protein